MIGDLDGYVERFRWLRTLEGDRALADGSTHRAVIDPPGPLRATIDLTITDFEEGRRVAAQVSGDLDGHGMLELAPAGDGTDLTLAWTIDVDRRALRFIVRSAPWLQSWVQTATVRRTVRDLDRELGTG